MGHEADVRFVDAHAEGDGGDHDQAVLAQEAGLVALAGLAVEARVVREGGDAVGHQEVRGFLDGGAGEAVDDPGVAGVLGAEQVEELLAGFFLRGDAVLDVRAVEARDELAALAQVEAREDFLARGVGRGGGEGDPRDLGPAFVQLGQGEVVGAEVVAPLGDAVRLVDREKSDVALV